jgi:heme a synthase
LQLTIGISMVLKGFPLPLATAHNAGAALLLLAALALVQQLRQARREGDSTATAVHCVPVPFVH